MNTNAEPQLEVPGESRRKRIAKLLVCCDERLQTHPDDMASLMEISEAMWDMGRRVEALEFSRKVLARHPGHAGMREVIQRYMSKLGGASSRGFPPQRDGKGEETK